MLFTICSKITKLQLHSVKFCRLLKKATCRHLSFKGALFYFLSLSSTFKGIWHTIHLRVSVIKMEVQCVYFFLAGKPYFCSGFILTLSISSKLIFFIEFFHYPNPFEENCTKKVLILFSEADSQNIQTRAKVSHNSTPQITANIRVTYNGIYRNVFRGIKNNWFGNNCPQ